VDSLTQTLTLLIIVLAFVVSIIATQFIRRRRGLVALRVIPAYADLPNRIGEAIEADQAVHVSFGSAGLGGSTTLLALANAELLYQTTRRAVIGSQSPVLTVGDPTALALGQDTLRRAYASRRLVDRYRLSSIHWYPAGNRSLAFAAALTGILADDRIGVSVLGGSFGTELALPAEMALRRGQSLIATSDQPEGQAVAYVVSDQPLIGEEVFAAGAYLDGRAAQLGALVTLDVLRWLLILAILIPTVLAVADTLIRQVGGR
jgi:hypothetical protein